MSEQTEADRRREKANRRWEEAKKDIARHDRDHERTHGKDWQNPRKTR